MEHLDQDNFYKKDRLQKYCLSFEKSLIKDEEVVSKTTGISHELNEGCDEATKGEEEPDSVKIRNLMSISKCSFSELRGSCVKRFCILKTFEVNFLILVFSVLQIYRHQISDFY